MEWRVVKRTVAIAVPKPRVPERMSMDEFLAWDDGTDIRYELRDGPCG